MRTQALTWMTAAAIVVGLTGCAADLPVAEPTEPPQATPAATPPPTIDPVAELVLSVTSVQVLDSEGKIALDAPVAT